MGGFFEHDFCGMLRSIILKLHVRNFQVIVQWNQEAYRSRYIMCTFVLILAILLSTAVFEDELTVYFLDVGQGDAVLIQHEESSVLTLPARSLRSRTRILHSQNTATFTSMVLHVLQKHYIPYALR